MSKLPWHEASHNCAIARATHEALPSMTHGELAEKLGMDRHMVRYYLSPECKAAGRIAPHWAEQLALACRVLKTGKQSDAAGEFYRLAMQLARP